MSKNRPARPAHGGRVYSSQFSFPLTLRERLRVLIGGKVHVKTQLVVVPGAAKIPTHMTKSASWPTWPWKRETIQQSTGDVA